MSTTPSHNLHAAIARNRRRIWAVCYRMTGSQADADDLAQEAIARAMESAAQLTREDPTGWLLTIATRTCLDHLRRARVRRRMTELVDPLVGSEWCAAAQDEDAPDERLIRRDDVRFAVVVALQALSGKQRAALILRHVCERPMAEVAVALDVNENAVKALLHRARVALAEARHHVDVDPSVDEDVVRRFASALEAGSIEAIAGLLAEDVWGVVDDPSRASRKPNFGARAVARQWANAKKRFPIPVHAGTRVLNGESAVLVRLAENPEAILAVVHLETSGRKIKALRVSQDPARVATLMRSL
jgi:RNA polymerase sigma-70 factor (ECF subfamily)